MKRSKQWKLDDLFASKLVIPAVVFVIFFVLSLGIGGPAYMSDEIGYLSKASTIAGSTVYLSSSWFAGYSFMISPAFFLSADPAVIWNIILILNALMWAGSAALLRYIIVKTHPKASDQAVFLVTAGAMLYPSWLSMSSYAFATSGFVLVFMACLAALLKSDFVRLRWLGLAGFCAAYLCWIHPIGFLFLGLFVSLLLVKAFFDRRPAVLFVALGALALASLYALVVQPWFSHLMSVGTTGGGHYSAGLSDALRSIFTLDYWLKAAVVLAGLLFSTLIATFGLAAYGFVDIAKRFTSKKLLAQSLKDTPSLVMLLSALAVVAIIAFTAVASASNATLRVDQWIYSRYTEMYLLPLLAFGLLAAWQSRQVLKVAGFVVVAGILLSVFTDPQNTAYAYINKVNLQSFWPTHLPQSLRTDHYWIWGLLGAAGIACFGILATTHYKRFVPLLIAPLITLAGIGNYFYQQRIVHGYSSPSGLYSYIKDTYAATDCIGFTPGDDNAERFNLYAYYLHEYDIKRMSLEEWRRQDCKGPYLTYDTTPATAPGLQVKGLEAKSGLYMITQSEDTLVTSPKRNETPIFVGNMLVGYAMLFH